MSENSTQKKELPQRLESKSYSFLVDGTMPILEFDIASGTPTEKSLHLKVEIYNPLSGEVLEAKFPRGRVEVDNDGSLTYFSTSSESVNVSLFLGHNLQLSLHKDGRLNIRSPSKIVPEAKVGASKSSRSKKFGEVTSDTLNFRLE